MVSKAIEPLVPLAKSEGVQILRPKSAAKLRDQVRKRIWFRILWHLALNGPHNKYQLARVLRCRYSSIHDALKKTLTQLVEKAGEPETSRAGLPIQRIGLNTNGLIILLYFDPSILEHLDKVAQSNRNLFPTLFGNWEVFSQVRKVVAMELNAFIEEMWESRHFFETIPLLRDVSDFEDTLLESILIRPGMKAEAQSIREKLFSDGKNSKLLDRLLARAKGSRREYEKLAAKMDDSIKDLESYT